MFHNKLNMILHNLALPPKIYYEEIFIRGFSEPLTVTRSLKFKLNSNPDENVHYIANMLLIIIIIICNPILQEIALCL